MTARAIDALIQLTTDLRLLYVEDNEGGADQHDGGAAGVF